MGMVVFYCVEIFMGAAGWVELKPDRDVHGGQAGWMAYADEVAKEFPDKGVRITSVTRTYEQQYPGVDSIHRMTGEETRHFIIQSPPPGDDA